MSKRKRQNKNKPSQTPQASTKTSVPLPLKDLVLRVLSIAGLLLTIYLTWAASQSTGLAFCSEGSGCDIVQQSQWSRFLGIPLSIWGIGLYALLTIQSFSGQKLKRWNNMWRLSFIGVVISTYLTIIAYVSLGALCMWCLGSFGLLITIFVLVHTNKVQPLGPRATSWYAGNTLIALLIVAAMAISATGLMGKRGDPRLHELAQHLQQTDAKFYGAFWCPACAEQKRAFSGAADKLPYVECSPGGRNSPMSAECTQAGVTGFPTWVIDGRPYVGVKEPRDLAGLSGYKWEERE